MPSRPRRDVVSLRDARLRELVRHAAEHVPHYRHVFREQGIDPREIASAQDLRRLPLVEKGDVQRAPERFRSESVAAFPFPTSGSSGTPLVVHHDRESLLRNLVSGERLHGIRRHLLGAGPQRTLTITHPRSTGVRVRAYYRRATLVPARPGRNSVSVELPVEELARIVAAQRPDVIAGWGSSVESLFRHAAEGRVALRPPRLVRYFAEAMSEEGRRLVEDEFAVPVISTYSSVETFRIGFVCERRTGFHVHDDLCHVRVVRPDGADVGAGETGEVVVTNLVNRGTVLINYRLGDVAAAGGDPCPCGRPFPLLGWVQGRVSEIVSLPDGTRLHPYGVAAAVRVEGLLRFRLVQEEPRRFRLEVVVTDDAAFERVLATSAPRLRGVLLEPELAVVRMDELHEDGRTKFRRVVALAEPGA
jgi:phenylacetate-CoA ligase